MDLLVHYLSLATKAIFIENGWLEFDNIQDYDLYTNNNSKTNIRKFYDIND